MLKTSPPTAGPETSYVIHDMVLNTKPPSEFTMRSILALAGTSLAAFCTIGFQNAFGVFQEYYAKTLLADESVSTIGWLGTIGVFLLYLGSLFSGVALDLFGPVIMFWAGSVGVVLSLMMISLCKTYWQFVLAQGILLGLSMTLLVCPAIALTSQFFKRRRALAVGITIGGSSLGGVIWPILIHELLQRPNVGFGWTMRIVGFVMLPLLVTATVITRAVSPSVSSNSDTDVEKESPSAPAQRAKWDWSMCQTSKMFYTALGFFLAYFGMFVPIFFVTSYAVAQGISSDLAFYLISIVNGASLFGRILPGMVADRYGQFNLCIVMVASAGVIALCWPKATSAAGLGVFSAAYGFTSGGILSLQQGCAAQIATPRTVGTAIGFVMACASLSALAGTPIAGALASRYGWVSVSIYTGVSLLAAAGVLVIARVKQTGKVLAVV